MGKDLNGLPWWLSGKESTPPTNARDLGSILESARPPGEGNGNPLQYFCLGNFMNQKSLVGYSPWTR